MRVRISSALQKFVRNLRGRLLRTLLVSSSLKARENQDVYSDVGYGDPTSGPTVVWGRTGRVGGPGVVPEQIGADPLVQDTLKPALNLRTSGEDAGPFLRQPV